MARTKSRSLIHGWIPSDKTQVFQINVEQIVPKEAISLKFEDTNPADKVPVKLESKGLLEAFSAKVNSTDRH